MSNVAQTLDGRRVPARPKAELILDLCRGRAVLDLGCIDHSWRVSVGNPRWLHGRIRQVAASCTGVDYLERDVAELRFRGYDIVLGDVLRDPPPGTYDVVVAGDLIEHLAEPARFLDYISEALKPGGIAVITTPNPFYLAQTWEILIRRRPTVNPEHVAWFDPLTLTRLVDRSPLAVRELYWLLPTWRALWNVPGRLGRYARRVLDAPTRRVVARRPYLSSDFAAVLEHDRGERAGVDPQESAREVATYLGIPVRQPRS